MKYSTAVLYNRTVKFIRRYKNGMLLCFVIFLFVISIFAYYKKGFNGLILFGAYVFFIGMPIYVLFVLECKKIFELFSFLVGTYLVLFTLSWARYEFSIDREHQLTTIVTALMSTENRKDFSRLLSKITQSKIEIKPNILTFENIICTVANISDQIPSNDARDTASVFLNKYRDWSNSDLTQLDMHGMVLENINFTNARLIRANFSNATLINVNFRNAQLWNASFQNARIVKCDFKNADVRNSSFEKAQISNTSFKKSRMDKAHLFNASFNDVVFKGADLREAVFIKKNLNNRAHASEVINKSLKFELFLDVKTLYNAKLPAQVEEKLKKEYPRLFENPDNEKNTKTFYL